MTFIELSLAVISQQISMFKEVFQVCPATPRDTKRPKHMCKPTLCWQENLVDFYNTECQ